MCHLVTLFMWGLSRWMGGFLLFRISQSEVSAEAEKVDEHWAEIRRNFAENPKSRCSCTCAEWEAKPPEGKVCVLWFVYISYFLHVALHCMVCWWILKSTDRPVFPTTSSQKPVKICFHHHSHYTMIFSVVSICICNYWVVFWICFVFVQYCLYLYLFNIVFIIKKFDGAVDDSDVEDGNFDAAYLKDDNIDDDPSLKKESVRLGLMQPKSCFCSSLGRPPRLPYTPPPPDQRPMEKG